MRPVSVLLLQYKAFNRIKNFSTEKRQTVLFGSEIYCIIMSLSVISLPHCYWQVNNIDIHFFDLWSVISLIVTAS